MIVGSFIYILLIVSYDLSLNRIVRENMGKFMFIGLKNEISLLIVIICFVSFNCFVNLYDNISVELILFELN